ncbi:MAG: hypothetical protein V3U75_10730 [Methylococcaceae bacterium]
MKKNFNIISSAIVFISVLTLPSIPFAQSTGQDQIRVLTSTPKKKGQSLFSYMVAWRKGSGFSHRANGLAFIHGADQVKPTTDVEAARKLEVALNDALENELPSDRGAIAEQQQGKAEVLVSSREGYAFTNATFRDYSNQALSYNLPNKNFSSVLKGVSIDIVYSMVVEYLVDPAPDQAKKATGGTVKVQIDNGKSIEIKTDGKTTQEIEKDLAQALSGKAKFSTSSIYPNYVESNSRNYKPFDGGEVQLLGLSANSITIDINDPSLGVLTKFKFPDDNKPADVAGKLPYLFGVLIAGVLGYVFYTTQIKNKNKEEDDVG